MASKALHTRITEETHRRMKLQSVLIDRSMEEIIEEAIRDWLDVAETVQQKEQA